MDTENIVGDSGELRKNLEAIVRKRSSGEPQNKNVADEEDVSCAFGGEFGDGDGELVGAVAEATRDEENVGDAVGCDGKSPTSSKLITIPRPLREGTE